MGFRKEFIDEQKRVFDVSLPFMQQDTKEVKTWGEWVDLLDYDALEEKASHRYECSVVDIREDMVEREALMVIDLCFEVKKSDNGEWVYPWLS